MIRDITIGQYYPVESYIHKLDPRMKLLCTLGFIVSLFFNKEFLGVFSSPCILNPRYTYFSCTIKIYVKRIKIHIYYYPINSGT